MVAVHSTARGPALGGFRIWVCEDSRFAIPDVLRLSRAMTFKAAVAGLPLGGGKGVIVLRPDEAVLSPERCRSVLRDFGDTVQALAGAFVTAEDVGTSVQEMEVIAEQTKHVAGLSEDRRGSGDPSPWTALGCEIALQVVAERVFGSAELSRRSVAVIGLGHVGAHLARKLAQDGAELVISDVDPRKRALADELGARWTVPSEALTAEVAIVGSCGPPTSSGAPAGC
jgi:leucine dehydrogenase